MIIPLARNSLASLCTRCLAVSSALSLSVASAQAQTAYGYDSTNTLYSFSVSNPLILTPVGNIGFTPEGSTSTRPTGSFTPSM
jgi:hypothetical protein